MRGAEEVRDRRGRETRERRGLGRGRPRKYKKAARLHRHGEESEEEIKQLRTFAAGAFSAISRGGPGWMGGVLAGLPPGNPT